MPVVVTSSWLAHHGIEGQKWGVRRGPPYPIEDKVLRKGTKVRHITSVKTLDPSQAKSRLYVFNPDDENDKRIYRGAFGTYLRMARHLNTEYKDVVRQKKTLFGTKEEHYKVADRVLYEHEFEVVEDLKMPTAKEREDTFYKVFDKNKDVMLPEIQRALQYFNRLNGNNDELTRDNMYFWANRAMEDARTNTAKLYFEAIGKEFDAMVDDNNVSVYNGAHDPIIILNRDKVKETKVETIYSDVTRTAKRELDEIMQKQGKRTML